MEINLKNVEQLIFMDKSVQRLLPRYKYLFDQYNLSFLIPGMRSLAQRSVLDFLNALDGEAVAALEAHYGEVVSVGKLKDEIVDHYDCFIDEHENLCAYSEFKEFCVTRTGRELKLSFWRCHERIGFSDVPCEHRWHVPHCCRWHDTGVVPQIR